jgi:hypothetical protein
MSETCAEIFAEMMDVVMQADAAFLIEVVQRGLKSAGWLTGVDDRPDGPFLTTINLIQNLCEVYPSDCRKRYCFISSDYSYTQLINDFDKNS